VTVDEGEWLAQRFESHRTHLRAVAYRMLGSLSEADDAVQEAWLRLNRSDAGRVENLGGWLTTVVGRVCLDMLRSRKARREEPNGVGGAGAGAGAVPDPEQEALLADSVGLALVVVLDTLTPAERLAFVLHDLFAVPFDEIAPIVGRTPAAARQLASRARRRIQAPGPGVAPRLPKQRALVEAFLAASRGGDFDALLALLDPDIVVRADARPGAPRQVRGAAAVAQQALAFSGRARYARLALVNGDVGIVVAPKGRLSVVMAFAVENGKITRITVYTDPDELSQLDLAVLDA
jgi:RNA polymerase sigma-70 factor (ECF subfamily)